MKKIFTFFFLLTLFFIFKSGNVFALNNSAIAQPSDTAVKMDRSAAKMKMKQLEKLLGRKLTFKEHVAFKIARYKYNKQSVLNETTSKGRTAFLLSLIGLCLLVVPYAALASIPLAIIAISMGSKARKENKDDRKAKTAILLGIITLGLVVVAAIIVAFVLSSWSA